MFGLGQLKWKAARDNGKPVTGYTVRVSAGYLKPLSNTESVELSQVLVDNENTLNCRVCLGSKGNEQASKLGSGLYYAFQLTASNECGDTPNAIQWFRTQSSVPNAPSPLRCVSRTNHSISLEWDPLEPKDWNGSEVDSFIVQMNSGNDRGWEIVYTDKQCNTTVSGLTACHEYSFRLCAHNEEGSSQFTPSATFATILGVSSAPVIQPQLSAKKQTSSSILVCWESDEQFVDSIDNYRVIVLLTSFFHVQTKTLQDEQVSVMEVKDLTCRIKDLLPGVTYKQYRE